MKRRPGIKEIWKQITGLEGYFVSNYGRVKSYRQHKKKGKLKKQACSKGFYFVIISVCGKQKSLYIHKIVAEAFIENPDNSKYVKHVNGDKNDNFYGNLKWITAKETKIGKHNKPGIPIYTKLKPEQVSEIKFQLNNGAVQAHLAREYGISDMQITRIKRGENWSKIKPAII